MAALGVLTIGAAFRLALWNRGRSADEPLSPWRKKVNPVLPPSPTSRPGACWAVWLTLRMACVS